MCQPIDPLDREWDTAEQAWAKAVLNVKELNTFSTCDQIQQAWGVAAAVWPDKFAARKAFCDTYDSLVAVAKSQGLLPVWWMSLGQESPELRAAAIERAVDAGQVSIAYKADAVAMLEQSKPLASNVSDHLAKMKALFGMAEESLIEKQMRMNAEMQERKQKQIDALANRASTPIYAPDPFLDAQEYADAMANAGKSVNLTLRSEYEKMGVTV